MEVQEVNQSFIENVFALLACYAIRFIHPLLIFFSLLFNYELWCLNDTRVWKCRSRTIAHAQQK